MPHSHPGKRSHEQHPHRRRHQRAKHQKSKGYEDKDKPKDKPKDQPVKGGGEAAAQVPIPIEQPKPSWSRWFAGDNGRWFYQARLKADGSGWEYQFTEGYPTVTQRQGVAQYGMPNSPVGQPTQTAAAHVTFPAPSPAVHMTPVALPEQKLEDIENDDDGDDDDDDDEEEEDHALHQEEVPPAKVTPQIPQSQNTFQAEQQHKQPAPLTTTAFEAAAAQRPGLKKSNIGGGVPEKKAGKAGGKKKLSVVVRSEKDLKFNPKKKVKGWLSEVGA